MKNTIYFDFSDFQNVHSSCYVINDHFQLVYEARTLQEHLDYYTEYFIKMLSYSNPEFNFSYFEKDGSRSNFKFNLIQSELENDVLLGYIDADFGDDMSNTTLMYIYLVMQYEDIHYKFEDEEIFERIQIYF